MGVSLTTGTLERKMVRLVGDDLCVETVADNLYAVPPQGEYEFTITGYALPFELPKAAEYGGGTQTMTRLELTFKNGKMTTLLFGFSIGPRSNLRKFLDAVGVDMSPDERGRWDLDYAIGYKAKGLFKPSDKLNNEGKPKFAIVATEFITPVAAPPKRYSIELSEEQQQPTPYQAPATNGNGHNGHHATDDGWE